MEIKEAKSAAQSDTIQEAKRSERLALGLLIGSVLIPIIWVAVPEQIKAKMTPFIAIGGAGVATAFQRGAIKIRNGRMAVGDLPDVIKNYVLLPAGEAQLLKTVKPFVEGTQKLQDLPNVRSLIDLAVKEATKPKPEDLMHEQVWKLKEQQREAIGPTLESSARVGSAFPPIDMGEKSKTLADLADLAEIAQERN